MNIEGDAMLCGMQPLNDDDRAVVLPGRLMPQLFALPKQMWPQGHEPVPFRSLAESHVYEDRSWIPDPLPHEQPPPPASRGFWGLAHGRGLEWTPSKMFMDGHDAVAGTYAFMVMKHSVGEWSSSWVNNQGPVQKASSTVEKHANEHAAKERCNYLAFGFIILMPMQSDRLVKDYSRRVMELIAREGEMNREGRRWTTK